MTQINRQVNHLWNLQANHLVSHLGTHPDNHLDNQVESLVVILQVNPPDNLVKIRQDSQLLYRHRHRLRHLPVSPPIYPLLQRSL